MRTFNQSNKSKKTIKKEAKKMAEAQNGQDSNEYGEDEDPGNGHDDSVLTAREKLKNKFKQKNKPVPVEAPVEESAEDSDAEYRRKRTAMAGPLKSVDIKDMQAIKVNDDGDDDDEDKAREKLERTRNEFFGGEEDDLKKLGFLDSDDEIDFSNFKIGKKDGDEDEQK
jgi:hypothetical protein